MEEQFIIQGGKKYRLVPVEEPKKLWESLESHLNRRLLSSSFHPSFIKKLTRYFLEWYLVENEGALYADIRDKMKEELEACK